MMPFDADSVAREAVNRAAAEAEGNKLSPTFFDPWADPPPPEFPGGVLYREMEHTVFAASLRDGICPGLLAMAYLAAASGAASKAIRFTPYQNSTWSVPPTIWVMAIAASGQRKTAVEDIAFAPLRAVHGETWGLHHDRMRAWNALPGKDQRETPKPEEPHSFLVEDSTAEKLQMILAETDRGTAMVRDEIAGLLEFGRYGSNKGAAERAFYLQAYEGGQYTVSRVSRDSLHIAVNGVTIYGSIQPDRLKDFPDLAKDGLLQRFNMVRASTAASSRDDITVAGADKIATKIAALTRIETRRYRTTPEGSILIRETEKLGQELSTITDFGSGFQGACTKLHGTHARYALVLHLLNNPYEDIIPTDTVERAGILVREFILPQTRDFFATAIGSPFQQVVDVAGWILTRPTQRFLSSDVTAGVRACRGIGSKQLGEILDPLVTGGWVEPESPYPNNRAWIVHPKLREVFKERVQIERERREAVHTLLSSLGRKS